MIKSLMRKAHKEYLHVPCVKYYVMKSVSPAPLNIHPRLSKFLSCLELLRKFPRGMSVCPHVPEDSNVGRGSCVWCSVLFDKAKRAGEEVSWDQEVKRTLKICGYCSAHKPVFLCREYFSIFHQIS